MLTVVMIGLGDADEVEHDSVLKLLDTLFSADKRPEEKKAVLENEFEIPMTVELESEVDEMGGIGRGLYEDAYEKAYGEAYEEAYEKAYGKAQKKTMTRAIVSLMEEFHISIDRAMQILKIEDSERDAYQSLVDGQMAVK